MGTGRSKLPEPRSPEELLARQAALQSEADENWELDIWFIHEDTRQPDMLHLETIPPHLTPETRLAILTIKDVWRRTPDYGKQVSSYGVCTAVLDHDARTPADFERYLGVEIARRAWLAERDRIQSVRRARSSGSAPQNAMQ